MKGGGPDKINDGGGSKLTGTIANFGDTTYCVRSRRVRPTAGIVKIFFQ
jgi:hypothetical protein